jgi:peptidoglycan/xylan/chitin deacetylase (PgdA/CDA1 family)
LYFHLTSLKLYTTLHTMVNTKPESATSKWPNGARAALVLTIDNMGEAADLDRNLWPQDVPIGNHFSVKEVIPQFLAILAKYDISATYFVESWNFNVYPSTIRDIVGAGHEIGWHAWRHEAWSKIGDEDRERTNFARSFGKEGLQGFLDKSKQEGTTAVDPCKGFRPPGGIIHGQRTLGICR